MSTGFSPFELNSGQKPYLPIDLVLQQNLPVAEPSTSVPTVDQFFTKMQANIAKATDHLQKVQDSQQTQANKKRRDERFVKSNKVLIPTEALLTEERANRPNASLRQRYIGFFVVEEVLSEVSYKLQLPFGSKAHPVFHISNLKWYFPPIVADGSTPPIEVTLDKNETDWEIEDLLKRRTTKRGNEYLVK